MSLTFAISGFGYAYPVEQTMKVSLRSPKEDKKDSEPVGASATGEEIAACEQNAHDLACKEYAELMQIVQVGAYVENAEDGSYWYPDLEGQNISARLVELESAAFEDGLHFVSAQNGEVHILEPATPEELAAYQKAKEEADTREDEE